MRRILFVSIIILSLFFSVRATHIVGADFYYTCLGNHLYEITLKLFRDCKEGQAPYDKPLYLFIFQNSNPENYTIYEMNPDTVPVNISWEGCLPSPPNLCVSEGTYKLRVFLPPRIKGYDIAWARCCRNYNITNLVNPLERGITYLATIPGMELLPQGVCNSMPYFKNRPSSFICTNQDFYFDHSAIDPDGDSLVYEISNPYDGTNLNGQGVYNPTVFPGTSPVVNQNNPIGYKPYKNVPFAAGYSYQNPFGNNQISIDPYTGFLRIRPNQPGIYVMAISVKEYRNGILLSENKRDIQIYVLNCLPPDPPPLISHDFGTLPHNGDTLFVSANQNFCYNVIVNDTGINPVLQAFAVNNAFGGPGFSPPYATISVSGSNPLIAKVCWKPSCTHNNQIIPLIVGAKDLSECLNHNPVYDTVYVKITAPVLPPPSVVFDLNGTTFSNDTIFALLDNQLCFKFKIINPPNFGSSNITYDYQFSNYGNRAPTVSNVVRNGDTLSGVICWNPDCEVLYDTVVVTVTGINYDLCPPNNQAQNQIYIVVNQLYNPPPILTHDYTGLTLIGDTIQAELDSSFCFYFTLRDTLPASRLSVRVKAELLNAQPLNSPSIHWIDIQDTLLTGKICWKPDCDAVEQKVRIIVTGIDSSLCLEDYRLEDTTYVYVKGPIHLPPSIAFSFPNQVFVEDTLIVNVKRNGCFEVTLTDVQPEAVGILKLSTQNSLGIQLETISYENGVLKAKACFVPDCEFTERLFKIDLIGWKEFDCAPSLYVYDSLFVRVIEPENQPPVIRHIFETPEVAPNTISVEPGQKICYTIELTDPDTFAILYVQGLSQMFQPGYAYGGNAIFVDTFRTANQLRVFICMTPNCYSRRINETLIVCGYDTTTCQQQYQVCDTITLQIRDCLLSFPNVFTPNGDGINDFFQPFALEGILKYEMKIYDRWGELQFETKDSGKWNGNRPNGKPCVEGVYFFVLDFTLHHGSGPPITGRFYNHFTLLR